MDKNTLKITCNVSGGRYRGGRHHDAGTALYSERTFSAVQLANLRDDPDFLIEWVNDGTLVEQPPADQMSLEDSITAAVTALTPAAEDYGIEQETLYIEIEGIFEAARRLEPEDLPDDHHLDVLVNACKSLLEDAPRDESLFAGKVPKTKALSEIVGWRVTGHERDKAMKILGAGD